MSTFNKVKTLSPYNENDYVLELVIDTLDDSYLLENVIKVVGDYVFSIWIKGLKPCTTTINVFGTEKIVNVTTEWQEVVQKVKVTTLTNKTISITPENNSTVYLYQGFLAEGTVNNAWLPAPEDSDANMQTIKSEFIQRAESIEARVSNNEGGISSLKVDLDGITGVVGKKGENFTKLQQDANNIRLEAAKKKDTIPTRVRYIRDYLNGNDRDDTNTFCKIQVFTNETNLQSGIVDLAKGIVPTSDVAITNPAHWTDDSLETFTTLPPGNHYLQLDLTTTTAFLEQRNISAPEIHSIKLWHHTDGRKCNHKLQVSADGINWHTLYDSNAQGSYAEKESGNTYYISENGMSQEMSYINVTMEEISQIAKKNEENYSAIVSKYNDISLKVESNEKNTNQLKNELLPSLEKSLNEKFTSELNIKTQSIEQSVTAIKGDLKAQSSQILEAGKWEVHLANIGAYDKSKATQEVNMRLDGNGLTIDRTNAGGYATQITGDTIKISYFDGAISKDAMIIDKDKMKLSRLYVNNGIEHGTIKELPIKYGNISALAFIASKGSNS